MSSYAIDDLHLQTALLDAVEAAVGEIVAASEALSPVLLVGAPLRHGGRLYNCGLAISRGRLLGVVPKSYLPNYREYYEKRWFSHGRDAAGLAISRRRPRRPLRLRPDLRGDRPAGLHPAPRDLRGLLGRDPALLRRRAERRDHPRQPLRLQHHHRQVRRAPHALPLAILPRRRGLRLFRRRPGREHHRPRLGRPGGDLRAGRHARGIRALRAGAGALHRRRRYRPHSRRTDAHGHLRRRRRSGRPHRPSVPPGALRAPAELRGPRADPADPAVSVRAEPQEPSRPGLLRGVQHPGGGPAPPPGVHRLRAHGDRRLRRPRFDPRADRRLQGLRPSRAPALDDPRLSPCPASPPATRRSRTPGS